nr:fibrous sheath-interacting protein 2 [Oncorhynchus nerka]XP_029524841.1 fibrous sheath-interacting protein 2 [Oncorhynchus nerka]
MRVIDVSYNCLHDKHLKSFFRHPERKKRLVKQGLITSNEKVLCSCKEYNRYSSYIKSVQLLWEKQCCAQQKMLLKQFLVLQQQGEVPSHISLTDIRDWLIAKGRNYFKNTFQSEMEEGKNLHLAELAWDVKRRLRLKELEREVCRELRLERRIRWSVIGQPGSQMGDWRPLGMETHTPLGMDTLSSQISTENLEVARLHTARPHIARPQTTRPRSARPPTERPSSGSDHSGTLSSVMTCSPHSASPSVVGHFGHEHVPSFHSLGAVGILLLPCLPSPGKSISKYSGKKKYVNPLELPGLLRKLVLKCSLIFI